MRKSPVLLSFFGLLISGSLYAFLGAPLAQVSSDPYTNSTSAHKTEVEPDTFSYGSTIVGAFQVGRFFDGGASNIGWSTSKDGGKTWSHGFLPGLTKYEANGGYDRVSDASVAYDAKHGSWLISSLPLYEKDGDVQSGGVVVNRSADGLNWEAPVSVATENATGYDKNWTVCDNTPRSPYYGNCYTEWDDNSAGNQILMSTSNDGGKTWSAPQTTAANDSGLGGQPVVQPNGSVIVPIGNANLTAIKAFKSTDGGKTWAAAVNVEDAGDHQVAGHIRTEPLPSAEIDGAGNVYSVWQTCKFEDKCSANDIVMSTSADGESWTPAVRIPIDAVGSGVDHFIPGLAVDKDTSGEHAHLALTYYYYPKADCEESGCQLFVGSVTSADGGKTWTAPVTLAGPIDLNSVPLTSQGKMVGDYISTSFVEGKAFPIFATVDTTGTELAMHSLTEGTVVGQGLRKAVRGRILSPSSHAFNNRRKILTLH